MTQDQTTEETGRIALVTGASRGLGAALAEGLARRGFHVLAVARTVGGLEELDDRIRASGGSATLAPMDVTDAAAMQQMVQAVAERWGGLDLWAHCAIHAAPLSPAPHIDGKDWSKSLLANVEVVRGLIALIEPLLRIRQSTALFFDDPRAGQKFFGAYGATKAAQIALVRSWQAENAAIGPRVVIAEPAAMPTATRGRFFPGEDRAVLTSCRHEAERILDAL
ncbi:MAG: SDR family oxidoreductase [Paracoccus sp. (in: a-proteobacteria)]|jgi:NAD(P)-dependent dehydrogenase (short-subunit alcohol dehydrogenase family)|uniref:SDR family NAD(P)-dependent oxidoreductase n=1 Tax=unclassified Paracoccus (in: a-proteobacteria) TaxID=2688777 RepID=UPI000C4CC10B|nr:MULTISPECIES: SDR family oxidoreductase [unclassified Paracoccus (in: a-proteobacteria)]MAN55992.1 oxidoreductase [Paracoccus sp. (in: a-proteobacteria)]MBA47686.1 oxidoreductase [Paracoccus sp. (in: a-proteobacteria)]HIC66178.1 SDR family oxidoreductase [Paracoccus sp. (in: a-proteobacteria)]|tara:strand:+ start:336 stop:1004 length:669 start_codon:yes stop_codon:yes gene_type:complete